MYLLRYIEFNIIMKSVIFVSILVALGRISDGADPCNIPERLPQSAPNPKLRSTILAELAMRNSINCTKDCICRTKNTTWDAIVACANSNDGLVHREYTHVGHRLSYNVSNGLGKPDFGAGLERLKAGIIHLAENDTDVLNDMHIYENYPNILIGLMDKRVTYINIVGILRYPTVYPSLPHFKIYHLFAHNVYLHHGFIEVDYAEIIFEAQFAEYHEYIVHIFLEYQKENSAI